MVVDEVVGGGGGMDSAGCECVWEVGLVLESGTEEIEESRRMMCLVNGRSSRELSQQAVVVHW
jgi:hypothetical protein